jgi:hypothetical protein
LSLRVAAQLLADIALAADAAHQQGIIHRDLKPGNILIDKDWKPHVADFGLAKQETADSVKGISGYPIGTLAYMPPEQAAGDNDEIDCRSDVYSLGMILYEMLTGVRPFEPYSQGIDLPLVLKRIQSEEPKPPRAIDKKLPYDLEVICLKAISKTKEHRYGTAKELAEDLLRFVDGEPVLARPMTALERGTRWYRKNRGLATTALIVFSIGLFSLMNQPRIPLEVPAPRPVLKPLTMEITTDPPGAQIALFPLESLASEPRPADVIRPRGTTPLSCDMMPGTYLIVAKLDDDRFHEVYRQVPNSRDDIPKWYYRHQSWEKGVDGKLSFPKIEIPELAVTEGMADFPDAKAFVVRAKIPGLRSRTKSIAAFLMDRHEVTIGEFRDQFGGEFAGNLMPEHPEQVQFPMTGTLFDYAVTYLERRGKRLPTEFEYEFAATDGGKSLFPWGDEPQSIPWRLSDVQ